MNYKRNSVVPLRRISLFTMGLMAFLAFCIALTGPALALDLLHNSTDTGSGTSKWPNGWGIAGGRYGQFICATCHEPDADNSMNIRATISSMNSDQLPGGSISVDIKFLNQTSMGDDSVSRTSSNRICEVCHSQNKYHNYSTTSNLSHGGSLGHPSPKQNCVSCHKHNTGFKAACGGCHGNPPTSASLGNYSGLVGTPRASKVLTANQPGAHRTHVNGRSLVCDTCHYLDPQSGQTRMPGQSGSIQIGFFGFGGKVTSGTYTPFTSAGRGYPFVSGTANTTIAPGQTLNTNANICSNVYCHGGGAPGKAPLTGGTNQTPRWDGTGQGSCGTCHGASTSATTMGNHPVHAGSVSGYSYTCDTCHPVVDSSHVQGSVRWQFSASDQRVAGSKYQAAGAPSAENSGATGNLAPSDSYGSCSNVYCHYNDTPQWGATLPSDCSGCHGGDEFSAGPMVKNAHRAHDFNRSARFDHFDFKCQDCHSDVVDASNRLITDKGLHSNQAQDVAWSALATRTSGTQTYNNNDASCSTTYCHSNGRNGAPNVSTLSWLGTPDSAEGTFTCNSCHGGFAGYTSAMKTDRHYFHITTNAPGSLFPHKPITCDKCHDNTIGPDGQSINHANGLHINKDYNVTFAKFANRSGVYEQLNNRTCRSTYCHGRNNPSWNSTTAINCGACHQASRTATYGLSSSHRKHYYTTTLATAANGWTNVNASSGANNIFRCGVCHAVNPAAQHTNGQAMPNGAAAEVVISLPFPLPAGAQYPADGIPVVTRGTTVVADSANYFFSRETTCQVYCHSDARGGPPKTPMYWANTATSCGNCHNKAGDANPTWSGAHTTHLTSPISTAATCNACHARTASGNNTLASRRDLHPNGFRNVTGNATAGPFRWTGTTCTNVTCHYGGTTPDWESGHFSVSHCIACHGGTAATANPMNKMGHGAHVNNQTAKLGSPRYNCNECHFTVVYSNNTSILSTSIHVNGGTATVTWGPLSNGGGAYNAGACATIYCHSSGQATPVYRAPTNWRSIVNGVQGTVKCDYCHNGTGTNGESRITTGRHTKHLLNSGDSGINHAVLKCSDCHHESVDSAYNLIDGGRHLNRSRDVNMATFANRSGLYSGNNCSATYCHGRNNPNWTSTTINCGSCHASNNTFTFGLSSTHRKHYNSGTNVSNTVGTNYGWNVTRGSSSTAYVFYCGVCHNLTPLTEHVNGPYDADGSAAQVVISTLPFPVPADGTVAPSVTYGTGHRQDGAGYLFSTGTTCTVYCHSNGRGGAPGTVMYWASTSSSCGNCHNSANDGKADSWSTPHSRHIRDYFEGGNSSFSCYACHKSTVNSTGVSIANFNKHVNGYRNVSSSSYSNFTYVVGSRTCNSGYCHSDGKASGSQYASPVWTTIGANCTGCHGSAAANSTSGSALSGKHSLHLNPATYGSKCAACHYKTAGTTDNLTMKVYSGVKYHVNKTRDIIMNPAYGGTVSGTSPNIICTNSYCHTDGRGTVKTSPNWSTGATSCILCHNGDAGQAAGNRMATNRHAAHMNNLANLGVNFSCSVCHALTVADGTNTTIAAGGYAFHVNKAFNVSFGKYSGTASGTPDVTCANTRCHSGRNPTWVSTATTSDHKCTKCHGAVGVTNPTEAQKAPGNGRDLDGSTSTSPTKDVQIGSHQQHLGGLSSTGLATVRCIECHRVPNNATDNNHLGRRAAEVTFANSSAANKNGAAASYTFGSPGVCRNVYCHGAAMPRGDTSGTNRTTVSAGVFWNQTSLRSRNATPTVADCAVCHGAPPTSGASQSIHSTYVGQGLGVCNGCHTNVNLNGTFTAGANRNQHINGRIDSSQTCSSCHDYDTVGATYSGGVWSGGTWGTSSRDGLTPNEGWGAHARHINYIKTRLAIAAALTPTGQTFGSGEPANICGSCHSNYIANHTTTGSMTRTINFGDSTFKIGGTGGSSFNFGTFNPLYDGSSGVSSAFMPKSCSNISCHYITSPVWSTY